MTIEIDLPIDLRDAEIDRLARELAVVTGEPVQIAVKIALRERLDRLSRKPLKPDLSYLIDRGRARPVLDDRPEEDILGYGPKGFPE